LVKGSVTRAGDRLRITAQLIHAATDRHLWAGTFNGQVCDVLDLQSKVARAVAATVQVKLTRGEELRLAASRQVHPEAYSMYLKGRYCARNLTEEGQRKAIQYFQDSIHVDPNYAAPFAGIAECLIALAFFFGMVPKEAFSQAKVAAEKAVQLEDTLADGHAVLGLLRLLDEWDWNLADAEFKRAVELAPGDAYVHWKHGMYLQYAGRGEEAVAAHRRAEQLDPFSLVAIEEAGWPLYYSRRYDEAAAQFRKVIELAPEWHLGHFGLGLVLVQQGNHEEALEELRCCARLSGSNALIESSLAYACGTAGCRAEASQILERLTANDQYVPNWFLSLIWVGMGEKERAFQCLEKAFKDREPCMVSLNVDPMFDPLRPDARFSELVRRIAVPGDSKGARSSAAHHQAGTARSAG
jgi:tetratricopeptide (TPR) repeat protein